MIRAVALVFVVSGLAQASVLWVPIAQLASSADLVVIGTGAAPRSKNEMASLELERTLKGAPLKIVSILEPGTRASCATSPGWSPVSAPASRDYRLTPAIARIRLR